MTVSSSVSDTRYAGNGSTTAFATGFTFYAAASLRVSQIVVATGVETVKTLTTHYTVAGGSGATGTVTMLTAPPAGQTLVIQRIEPYTQETDLIDGDPLPANVLESTYDKIVMQVQQIYRRTLTAIQAPASFDPNTTDPYIMAEPTDGTVPLGNGTGWNATALASINPASIPVSLTSLANRDLLEYDSASTSWKNRTLAVVLGRMLTTAGDIIVNAAGTVSRLAKGADGTALSVVAGQPAWVPFNGRTAVNDANYTVLGTDCNVVFTALSAARTVTLPAANTFAAGQKLVIHDASGSASETNKISLAPNGTDTIAGSNTTQVCVNEPRGTCVLCSNGSNGWEVSQWSVFYIKSLTGDVTVNNSAVYFDGPSIDVGTVGRWQCGGHIVSLDTVGAAQQYAKLWDGTSAAVSSSADYPQAGNEAVTLPVSGMIQTPAGNIRISGRNASSNNGLLKYNYTGNSKDCTVWARRVG